MPKRLFTLKRSWMDFLDFEYLLVWPIGGPEPTLEDFGKFYGDMFYLPFHHDDEIIELGKKV